MGDELCKTPCKPVFEALEKKASLKVFMWVIVGIVALSGVLLNTKMETINIQMSSIKENVSDIKAEMKQMSRKGIRY